MSTGIFNEIWKSSSFIHDQNTYNRLVDLTKEAILHMEKEDRLSTEPFLPSRNRVLSLPFEAVNEKLQNKVCLVTGGLGCVGSSLLKHLENFSVKKIIIVDNGENPETLNIYKKNPNIKYESCDIRNKEGLQKIFTTYQPQIVFHTAAERNPGFAEKNISHTISTNIIGTWNLVNVCENTPSVEDLVFSSTGKASRYFTEEVYAGTKKICENILDHFSRVGRIRYSMVRFTHIVDNSLMEEQLKYDAFNKDFVAVHSPGKFVTAQNVNEAALLMLNALVFAEKTKCNMLMVKNLEWPVESLEIALYWIKQSRREIPLIFTGNPKGYQEKFFRGQMDWNRPGELNLLINVFENQKRRVNKEEDIIIGNICQADSTILFQLIEKLQKTEKAEFQRELLITGLKDLFANSLKNVDPKDTYNILFWGISPKALEAEKTKISDYGEQVQILFDSLKSSPYYEEAKSLFFVQA